MDDTTRGVCRHLVENHSIDWRSMLGVGIHNEMLALLYWHLKAACPDAVPAAVMSELQKMFCRTSFRNLALTSELMRLLTLLRRRGVEAVPFKGPLLGQSLYGNVALRRAIDLDLLVRKSDVAIAGQLLLEQGYELTPEMTLEQQREHLKRHYHFEFHRSEDNVHVELHWQLLPRNCGELDTAYVWDHLVSIDVGGQTALALEPEELFVLLCIHHGSKHEWSRLKWIADIGRLVDGHADMDWTRVLSRARALKQERHVLMGCFLVESLLGVPLPPAVRPLVRRDRSLGARAALICGRLFRSGHGLPGFREWCAYVDALAISSSAAPDDSLSLLRYVRYLFSVMTPEFPDRYALRLPDTFSFIHYLYRPARLWGRHRTALFKRLN
jgi:hypothetical protein